jgi:hypothetical protein
MAGTLTSIASRLRNEVWIPRICEANDELVHWGRGAALCAQRSPRYGTNLSTKELLLNRCFSLLKMQRLSEDI